AEKEKKQEGKKQRKKHPKHLKSTLYTVDGNSAVRKRQACPKCGPGIFMAEHKERVSCGKCGYTEWRRKES
ncbi:MAG: 30S ribosomal protein S27ae, partial [Candidatus Diapherotrites archaeon]|nr:30S ribosomal protein S27ae [Candidatus Diapherotrites archaeon]